MQADRKSFFSSELPERFFRRAALMLHSYSTGLVKITFREGEGEHGHLIGSGTFVSVGNCSGILTVQHVVELIDEPCEIGLVLIEGAHRPTIDRQHLEILEIAKPPVKGEGPDLAFIRLPDQKAREVAHYKHFYNLDFDRDEMLRDPPERHAAVWFVCGIPDEWTSDLEPEAGFLQVQSFYGVCGAGGANKIYTKDEYDYVDTWVEYKDDVHLPSTFGGISGGGLWQVPYSGGPPDEVEPVRYLLAGVPFAQSPIENGLRSIICHGWRSVYSQAYSAIEEMCS
jgi:hypothetical protein